MTTSVRITPLFLHLLLSLSAGPRHGYALMAEVEERTDGRVKVGPSSLYYALGRLEDVGLIAEADVSEPTDAPHAERRRYYRLTPVGQALLEDEMANLSDIVAHARARGVIS